MTTLVVNKKKFVVIEEKEYNKLQLLAAQKLAGSKKISLEEGRKLSLKLVDQWLKEK